MGRPVSICQNVCFCALILYQKNTSSESKAKLSGDVFCCKDLFVLALDGGLAVRSEGDYTDRHAEIIFHELDIVLEFLRKPAFLADFRKVFLPAGELFLVRLACVKHAASVRPEPGSNSQ